MHGHVRQRGSMTIIVVIMIVIVGLAATSITLFYVEDERATVDYLDATSAFFVAESGVEQGMRALSLSSSYTGAGPTAFGAGTFTITISNTSTTGAALPATDRRITSKGIVNGTARTLDATVRLGGSLFLDPFPNIAKWGSASSNSIASCVPGNAGTFGTGGTVAFDVDNAAGSSGGSFEVELATQNKKRTGSRRATITPSLLPGAQVTVAFKFKKVVGAQLPDVMMLAIQFVSTANNVSRVWFDCGRATTAGGWVTVAPIAFTVPVGQTINRIAIAYDLDSSNLAPAATFTARVDDVTITSSSGVQMLAWREDTH